MISHGDKILLNKLFKGSLTARLLDVFLDKHSETPTIEYSREELSKVAGTHYVSTSTTIQQLEKVGILKVTCQVKREKFYCLNYGNPIVQSFIIIHDSLKERGFSDDE